MLVAPYPPQRTHQPVTDSRGGDANSPCPARHRAHPLAGLPRTQEYIARRRSAGSSDRNIRHCLKRYVARELYRALDTPPPHVLDTHEASKEVGRPQADRTGAHRPSGQRLSSKVGLSHAAACAATYDSLGHRSIMRCIASG